MTTKLKCSRCGCKKEVSDDWSFSQCPDCLAKQRTKTAIENMNKPVPFNPEPAPEVNPFISFSEYRNFFLEATWKQYNEARLKHIQDRKLSEVPEERHQLIPAYDEECIEVRKMLMYLIPKDALKIGIHFSDCGLCRRWFVIYKEDHIRFGVNLWADSEPVTKEEQANNERDRYYNEILRQELNR